MIILSFKSYSGMDLSGFVITIPELTSAAALLHPGPKMSSPKKRAAEDPAEGETGSKRAYNYREWQEYTPEARQRTLRWLMPGADAYRRPRRL